MISVGKENASEEKWVHPADKHVVSVNHVAKNGNRPHAADYHPMAEQRPAHVGNQHMGNDPHRGNDRDVHLGMSKEPEQVLPQQSRSPGVWLQLVIDDQVRRNEKAGTGHVVENQENTCRHQHRKRRESHAGRDEPRPRGERQAHQAHAFHPQIESRGDEIQRAEQLAYAKDGDGSCPKNFAHALARTRNRTNCAQRRVLRPPGKSGSVANEKRGHHHQKSDEGDPERHHVEARERHVFRPNLNGQEEIAEGRERRRGEHEEDHDGSVHGHQLQVVFRRHDIAGSAVLGEKVQTRYGETCPPQMQAHDPGEHHADEDRHQGQRVILFADYFVVEAENVLSDKALRRCMVLRRMCRNIVHRCHLKPDMLCSPIRT